MSAKGRIIWCLCRLSSDHDKLSLCLQKLQPTRRAVKLNPKSSNLTNVLAFLRTFLQGYLPTFRNRLDSVSHLIKRLDDRMAGSKRNTICERRFFIYSNNSALCACYHETTENYMNMQGTGVLGESISADNSEGKGQCKSCRMLGVDELVEIRRHKRRILHDGSIL